jgi:hypothetical protein
LAQQAAGLAVACLAQLFAHPRKCVVDERLGVSPAYTAASAAEQPNGSAQFDERRPDLARS